MKVPDHSQLIYDDDDSRLNIQISPEVAENGGQIDKSDEILADLLSWLKSFNLQVQLIRKNNNIKVLSYPLNPSRDQVLKIILSSTTKNNDNSSNDIDSIMRKYHLTPNWYLSTLSAVYTNTLLIPMKLSTVQVYSPKFYEQNININSIRDLGQLPTLFNSPELKRARRVAELSEYPVIYFTHRITVNEFKTWLNNNKRFFRALLYDLPTREIYKRDEKARFWGKIAWIYIQDGLKSWSSITKEISNLVDSYKQKEEIDINDIIYEPPGEIEIEKYYKRFVESLARIDNLT